MSYRDRKTGRFVSAATWKRSKTKGGIRYVREGSLIRERRKQRKTAREILAAIQVGREIIEARKELSNPKGAKYEYDSARQIVKITIKTTDTDVLIHGHIVERKGSKIKWEWENIRKKYRRGRKRSKKSTR